MAEYIFGIDIGGTTVKIGLFREEELIRKWEIPTRTEESGSLILKDIARAIEEELKSRELTADDVSGIGVGVPGPVLTGGTVNGCVNLGWGVLNAAQEMKELTGVSRVRIGNDANVAALGEMWKGGAAGHTNVVMVTLGTGVGGGIIIGGKVVNGSFGAGNDTQPKFWCK